MIEVRNLTKRYGTLVALDSLSFSVSPGCVTGFLGPNGAGKSTTMRILLGLAAPSSGEALILGKRYVELRRPMHQVGALLDATAVYGGRSAFDHLYSLALTNGIGRRRVGEVLELVGLAGAAGRKVGAFSLGMKQRLGIAAALLGDPQILILDEPVNGLDPEGVRWFRSFMRGLAAEGRTIFLSSHLMSEVAITADQLVVIGRGQLIAATSVAEITDRFQRGVIVTSPRAAELAQLLETAGATVAGQGAGSLLVSGLASADIGELAAGASIPIHEMRAGNVSLEEAYTELTSVHSEHHSAGDHR